MSCVYFMYDWTRACAWCYWQPRLSLLPVDQGHRQGQLQQASPAPVLGSRIWQKGAFPVSHVTALQRDLPVVT